MSQLSHVAAAFVVGALAGTAWAQRPEALKKLQRHREALVTGVVEYGHQRHRLKKWETFYTGRFAEQDNILVNRGDSEGVVGRALDGSVPGGQYGPRITLKANGETWVTEGDGVSARLYDKEVAESVLPMRTLGVSPMRSRDDLHETLWRDHVSQPSVRRYRERVEGGLHVVVAETDLGTTTWWIDPKRDWSAVRITFEQYGEVLYECRNTLKRFDGRWYPETVLYFAKHFKDGKQPTDTIKVHKARFNKPEHPRRFLPKDIGIEAGVAVEHSSAGNRIEMLIWDGSKALTQVEYAKREQAGEVRAGPGYLRAVAKLQADRLKSEISGTRIGKVAGFQRRWEQHTREFIARFRLNADQVQKALTILQDSLEQAQRFLQKAGFEKLQRQYKAAASAENPPKSAELSALSRQRAKLMESVDKIFESQLKPRLERLPTRIQRELAETAQVSSDKKP